MAVAPPTSREAPDTVARGPVLPFRLRYLLLLAGACLGLRELGERAHAYWQLHVTAKPFANYGACMAGPTGPALLREHPAEFWGLVRRRLVTSAPEARPFAACVPALVAFAGDERRAAHAARADAFREYAPLQSDVRPQLTIADLHVTSDRLSELMAAAAPFSPASLDELMRPDRKAKSAPHPMEPPRAARGRGLPSIELGYSALRSAGASHWLVAGQGANASVRRSDDGGLTWVEADDASAWALAGQCLSGEGKPGFKLRQGGDQLRVDSWLGGNAETSFPLADSHSRLFSFACDATAAVAITHSQRDGRYGFRLCPHRAPCKVLAVPGPLRAAPAERAALSIARISGVTVISMARSDVVRVISSRDDGRSWTPPVVAFDRVEQGGGATPEHLLSIGSRLLLYAGGRTAMETYPSLWSTDFGASWQGR